MKYTSAPAHIYSFNRIHGAWSVDLVALCHWLFTIMISWNIPNWMPCELSKLEYAIYICRADTSLFQYKCQVKITSKLLIWFLREIDFAKLIKYLLCSVEIRVIRLALGKVVLTNIYLYFCKIKHPGSDRVYLFYTQITSISWSGTGRKI